MITPDNKMYIIIGVGLLFYALANFIGTRRLIKRSLPVVGTVIGYGQHSLGSESGGGCTAVFQYSVDGKNYKSNISISSKYEYPVGGEVEALYDVNRPSYAYKNDVLHLYMLEIISLIIGICFLFIPYNMA